MMMVWRFEVGQSPVVQRLHDMFLALAHPEVWCGVVRRADRNPTVACTVFPVCSSAPCDVINSPYVE